MKYYHTESYAHRFAKEVLAAELSKIESENDYCAFNGLEWRRNYGVFTELKFYSSSTPYYFETSDGLKPFQGFPDLRGENVLEWFDKNYNRGEILFVPDITIFHKGTPKYFIEIVHNHHLESKKIEAITKFFSGHALEVYEVSAMEILNSTGELKNLKFIEALKL